MRLISILLLAITAANLHAEDQPWRFGDSVDIDPEGFDWWELSVTNRQIPLATTFPETEPKVSIRWQLQPKVSVTQPAPSSDLLERPDELADLRNGKTWDPVIDKHTFWDATAMHFGEPGLDAPDRDDEVAMMFCTVYYTPLESGFTADRGFDMTLETRTGLRGKKYGHDFLRAVSVEGFGRLAEPVDGNRYIKYDGRWGYSNRILGNRNNTLVDRKSAAVYRRNASLPKNTKLTILDPDVFDALGSLEWNVADTGGGLKLWQIDLYWGEDVPLGTGMDRFRPAGCPFAVKFWLPVHIATP